MNLSIIIVNWNTSQVLKKCLNSIKATSDDLKIEIIVVDNHSRDESREMIKKEFSDVCLISLKENVGFARANNIAIPLTKAPYVLFLNPDTVIKPNTLKRMYEFIEQHPEVGAIGCKIYNEAGEVVELPLQIERTPIKQFFLQIFFSQKSASLIKKLFCSHNPSISGYIKYLYGPCIMVRKEILDYVGNFDEQFFMYGEDIDLCQRIYKKGWKLYYLSDVSIIHLEGRASNQAPKETAIINMCDSITKLMRKNYGAKGVIFYKMGVLISACLRLITIFSFIYIYYLLGKKKKFEIDNSIYKQIIRLKWTLSNFNKNYIYK